MEIVPGIHQVDNVNGNCYIIVRSGLTIIDTGIPGSGGKILAYIRNTLHRDPSEITTIFITHFHMDHTGALSVLKRTAPKAKIAIGEGDAGYLSGKSSPPVHRGFRGFMLRVAETVMKPGHFVPDIILHDGDQYEGLLCIQIPGHTPGSFAFLDELSKSLFAGDILRYDGNKIERGPLQFTMDPGSEDRSIRKIAGLEFETLLIGHGMPLRPGASRKVREFAGQEGPGMRQTGTGT